MTPATNPVVNTDPCAMGSTQPVGSTQHDQASHGSAQAEAPQVSGENGKSALAAACLAVGLASAWAPEAQAAPQTRIDYQTSLTSLTYMHLMIGVAGVGSGGPGIAPVELTGLSLPGPGSGFFTSEIDTASFGNSYMMIGISQASHPQASPRLVVSMDGQTFVPTLSFEQRFPGFTEAGLINDLINGGPGPSQFLRAFYPTLHEPLGEESNCFRFDSPDPLGTVSFSVSNIPTPASGLLGLLPAGYLTLRRRRSTH